MKGSLGISLIFALALCALGKASAHAEEAAPSGKKVKVFIMSGQSGMAGFGRSHELPDALRKGNDRVLMFEDGKWQPLRPFHVYPESLRKKFGQNILKIFNSLNQHVEQMFPVANDR